MDIEGTEVFEDMDSSEKAKRDDDRDTQELVTMLGHMVHQSAQMTAIAERLAEVTDDDRQNKIHSSDNV